MFVHLLQQCQALFLFDSGSVADELLHGRAKTEPARQCQTALAPAEAPGNRTQVFDFLQSLARGRARANIELCNFAQRRRGEEVLRETRGFVNQRSVGRHAALRQLGSGLQKRLGGRLGGLQQGRFQRSSNQGFEISTANLGIGIFGANHFTLLRQTNLATHGAGGLGQDGLVARAASTANRAAAAVKHAQLDLVLGIQHIKQFDKRDFCAVQLPVARKDAAVFVGVRVPQHDVLFGAAAFHKLCNAGQGIEVAHDGRGIAQVFNRFEQWHDDQVGRGLRVQCASHQSDFLLQQQHFQQIAHGFCVADDVVADGFVTKAFTHGLGCGKNSQFTLGVGGVSHAVYTQGSCII